MLARSSPPAQISEEGKGEEFHDLDIKSLLEKAARKKRHPTCYKSAQELLNCPAEEIEAIFEEAFRRLSEYEQKVILLRFNLTHEAVEYEKIGRDHSVSRQAVWQTENRATRKLCRFIAAVLKCKEGGGDIHGLSIDALELSEHSLNVLRKMDVRNVGDLTGKTREELLGARQSGQKSVVEIEAALAEYGLHIKADV